MQLSRYSKIWPETCQTVWRMMQGRLESCHLHQVSILFYEIQLLHTTVGTWSDYWWYLVYLWSVVKLSVVVLFIVFLCWLMAQCYVRRGERLPQAHAGHTVNPSTQSYWLTEVPPECSCDTNTHTPISTQSCVQDSLPTVSTPVFTYPQSTPHLVCVCLTFLTACA